MAEDIEIGVKLKADLNELKQTVGSVPLNDAQAKNVQKGIETAEKAFNAKDWDTFSKNFNKVSSILTQALAATGNISESLQRSLELKKKIEDSINQSRDRISKIQSKYTDEKMTAFTAKGARDNFSNWTKVNGDIKSGNNQTLGRDETVARLEKALDATSGNLQKLTDEMAKQAGFANRNEAFKANRYFKSEESTRLADIKEVGQLQKTVDTDQSDLQAVEQEIKKLAPVSEQAATSLEELYKKIVQITGTANADVTEQKAADREARKEAEGGGAASLPDFSSKSIDKQTSALGKAFKAFTIYSLVVRNARRALREAVKTVRELDKALTEQAMVTGLTRKQTYGLLKDYQNMASRLGTTTKEVSSTMTQFLRQGRSIAESTKLTEAAISAAKVAGISAADSINYLTTAVNGFRLSAEDAMKVSDKFAAVAAQAATSYEEIAIALSKVAAQANLAGMSIDYTTALLTKGIETTREAPETIGTALKTVIARMRELSDYGETLGGDTDINNVESQLAYIGIALRDNNGELRSTEDVLNDLGGQWDTLNANQQAAIAKALAGTRQQSRLIAMMSDYERVIELQEIAERSQGATMAQMATYLEGMDAAMNKVNNAWEQIVSNITDSDVIINLINQFSEFLNKLGDFLSTDFGMVATMTTIAILGLNIVGQKMTEQRVARENAKLQAEINLLKLKQLKTDSDHNLKLKEEVLKQKTITLEKLQHRKLDLQRKKDQGLLTAEEAKELQTIDARIAKQQTAVDQAKIEYELEVANNKSLQDQIGLQQMQMDNAMSLTGALSGVFAVLSSILVVYKLIAGAIKVATALKDKETRATMKAAIAEKIKAAWGMAGSASAIPFAGWAIAGAILAIILGVGIAAAIAAANQDKYNNSAEKSAKDVNKLSKEIYELNKKSTAIDTAISKFDDLDNKIIKTNDDLKEMSSILDSVADSLSDEEKEVYNSLGSDRARREYLEKLGTETEEALAKKRTEQINKVKKWHKNTKEWNKAKNSTDPEFIQAFDAIYALNNAALYDYIDGFNLKADQKNNVEKLVQSILDNVSIDKAEELMENPEAIRKYTNAILNATDAVDTLNDSESTLVERVEAYEKLRQQIYNTGDQEAYNAFIQAQRQWQDLSLFDKNALDYVDKTGKPAEGMNDLATAIQKLGYNVDDSREKVNQFFELLSRGYDAGEAIRYLFKDLSSEDFNRMINTYEKSFGTTVLNMGQNMDKFLNQIDSFYEKSAQWNQMSESDRTSFLSENAELFKGQEGAELLKAFQSGSYQRIAEALSKSSAAKTRENLLRDVEEELKIQYAKNASERDEAYIALLEEYKAQLLNVDNIYLASLERRLEQQKSQLDMYKDFLQQEADALTESLEKRRDAYQKYFDAINKEYEDEEYEEQAQTLIANISKLSSSNNADAIAKTADLTKQLEELEKERLQTLRQQAQEQIIKNIEDEVSKISDNLEDLLKNEQALLNAMMNDVKSPSEFIAAMLTAQAASGNNTELGMQSYLQDMQSTFASIMPGVDWSNVEVERQGDSLILNIMGKEIQLSDTDQQTIYDAIQQALIQIGKN